ncbi:hypothetical protein EVAR_36278_1 [Eumeta japonica]|uniref:Uncharacterized protein n=1 Tax=Eumeta variegata TaxID=151549 RepID=A0A4C1VHA8_EUMVA|nr:hypothetical protein EVAR_36278_1 [Eumeta japonica]
MSRVKHHLNAPLEFFAGRTSLKITKWTAHPPIFQCEKVQRLSRFVIFRDGEGVASTEFADIIDLIDFVHRHANCFNVRSISLRDFSMNWESREAASDNNLFLEYPSKRRIITEKPGGIAWTNLDVGANASSRSFSFSIVRS